MDRPAMPEPAPTEAPRPSALCRWLASAFVAVHLAVLAVVFTLAPSGPWPDGEGGGVAAPPPEFALRLFGAVRPYVQAFHLDGNARFPSNHPPDAAFRMEVHLLDDAGRPTALRLLPDPGQTQVVRNSYRQLAAQIARDQPVVLPEGEFIPSAGQLPPMIEVWEPVPAEQRPALPEGSPDPPNTFRIAKVVEHRLDRNAAYFAPQRWSRELVRSLAEFVRSREGVPAVRVRVLIREYVAPQAVAALRQDRRTPPEDVPLVVYDFGIHADTAAAAADTAAADTAGENDEPGQ